MSYVPPFKLPFANATNTISAAGTTQGTATALTTMHSRVTTTGANSGVKLPYAVSGMQCTVINAGANPLRIYPDTGAAIDGGSANAAIIAAPSEIIGFTAYSNTVWITDSRFLIDSNRKLITQNAHGFAAGDVLRRGSGSYAKAQADTAANAAAVGIVDTVLDANNFLLTEAGSITTLTGLTDGTVYYLSAATAGALTSTKPTIGVQILIATSSTGAIVNIFSAPTAGVLNLGSMKNFIDNPSFNVWQRGTSFVDTTAAAGNLFTADRWGCQRAGDAAGMTTTRSGDTQQGFNFSLKNQRTAGNSSTASMDMWHTLTTNRSLAMVTRDVTLSIYAKKGANYSGGVLGCRIVVGTGTDQRVYLFTGYTELVAFNATLTTSMQRFSGTVSIPIGTTQIGMHFTWVPTGTAGADDAVYITGIQLELGTVATDFEFVDSAVELTRCQRFFQKTFNQATTPADGTGEYGIGWSGAIIGNIAAGMWTFQTTMRGAPTITLYNPRPGGTAGYVTDSATDYQGAVATYSDHHMIVGTAAAETTGNKKYVSATADAEL